MPWDQAAPVTTDNKMTKAQRKAIIRLREVHDRVPTGTYDGDPLPDLDKTQAGNYIEKLRKRIEALNFRSYKKPQPCQMCIFGSPHVKGTKCQK